MKTFVKQVRISPKKVNLVADLVRGKSVDEADVLLKYLPKKAAGVLRGRKDKSDPTYERF